MSGGEVRGNQQHRGDLCQEPERPDQVVWTLIHGQLLFRFYSYPDMAMFTFLKDLSDKRGVFYEVGRPLSRNTCLECLHKHVRKGKDLKGEEGKMTEEMG